MNRKQFIKTGIATSVIISFPKIVLGNNEDVNFSLEEIKEFVFAAHKDYDKVKGILDKSPLLLNCANQAKKGDFETALGGASHMGRKDIADLLIERGARMDIFSMCFLGFTKMTKKLIIKHPQLLTAPGPHGFTLLHHARVGKHSKFAKWLEREGLVTERYEDYF